MALGASVVTISATNNRANASLLLIYRTDPFPGVSQEDPLATPVTRRLHTGKGSIL